MTLEEIKKYAKEIEGLWNGKDSGRAEDKAMVAKDILEKVSEIESLLVEVEDF